MWKFGGTSVADHARLRSVAKRLLAARRDGARIVAVLSAMGDTTDHLVRLAHEISPAPPPRELDALLCLGESVSCTLAAMTVHELGGRAVSLTGPQAGVATDSTYGSARLNEIRPRRIVEALNEGFIVFVTGFQGVSPNGDVTTLGRGGSDASAVALAVALGARRCEIFTDIPGVFTADPRVVPSARRLPTLGHEEMRLLSAAGAAVLQQRSVELAEAHDIDIHVRSSLTTEGGTWIRKEERMLERTKIVGVAHRRHDRLYAARHLSPAAVSSALARRGALVGTMVRHDEELRFTAPGAEEADVAAALREVGARVALREDLGTVSVVGMGIGSQPEITVHALVTLERNGIDSRLVKNTPNGVSCHIPSQAVDQATRLLHDAFGLHVGDKADSLPEQRADEGRHATPEDGPEQVGMTAANG